MGNVGDVEKTNPPERQRKTGEERERFRREVLVSLGATGDEVEELLGYGCSHFAGRESPSLPLADEPFVPVWREYAREAAEHGVIAVLQEKLVQLRFPIREGISREEGYRSATLKGHPPESEHTALQLADPEGLRLFLHQTPAGTIPVLMARDRRDFVTLVRALSMRNEPGPVPESMGATMISSLNNWDRIARYRRAWEAAHPAAGGGWAAEFSRLIPRKELYQDRFIVLSEGGYSGVGADTMGMTDEAWRAVSSVIRLEHECAHYFTRRVFGSMQQAVHDEFLADYAGITAAAGAFRSDWFLLFMGLEDYPKYRQGGRLQNYLGDPQPSARVFEILKRLVKEAAENLERCASRTRAAKPAAPPTTTEMLLALAALHMEELASAEAETLLQENLLRG